MKKLKLFHLKNEMLVANAIANFIGVLLGKYLDGSVSNRRRLRKRYLESPIALLD